VKVGGRDENPASTLRAHRLAEIALDPSRLSFDIKTILAAETQMCIGYAVGHWSLCVLLERDSPSRRLGPTAVGAALPYVTELISQTFQLDAVDTVLIFVAKRGGYVRPHCDWPASAPLYTRVHVPLQTDARCLNSEDDIVFHMETGEVWYVDPSRPHSGGCFSDATRLHLVLDCHPEVPLADLFAGPQTFAPSRVGSVIDREPFTDESLTAIYGLCEVASALNLTLLADMLGTIHFERQVSCAAVYDWLIEIARRNGHAELIQRAVQLKQRYLYPFAGAE
jgi:hypothetical protein